ncbi:uncharacterized protein BX663DRAFT_555873 [Cokeromyces recurvatus]|uniref:uncharacterized protein n=1 Tax=Cokeromyces recurvatus TaxID=90255 RepID=UPI00221FD39B|nr:uncharacterized protein BX663DRAFT_555873 [Cokeromyces recurvatus]KAI7898358.1 hypothetical protein BX663DRAFT_555873 [Cokeromyces recurvatus]
MEFIFDLNKQALNDRLEPIQASNISNVQDEVQINSYKSTFAINNTNNRVIDLEDELGLHITPGFNDTALYWSRIQVKKVPIINELLTQLITNDESTLRYLHANGVYYDDENDIFCPGGTPMVLRRAGSRGPVWRCCGTRIVNETERTVMQVLYFWLAWCNRNHNPMFTGISTKTISGIILLDWYQMIQEDLSWTDI